MIDKIDVKEVSLGKAVNLKESFSTSFPVMPLDVTDVKDFIDKIPVAASGQPPVFFKIGYIRCFRETDIQSGYKDSVKIVEYKLYPKVYVGESIANTKYTKEADKTLGTDRHIGSRNGFRYGEGGASEKIKKRVTPDGEVIEAIQAMIPRDGLNTKSKYYVSIDDSDLVECTKADLEKWLTPSSFNKIVDDKIKPVSLGTNAKGKEISDTVTRLLRIDQLYYLDGKPGKLGLML